MAEELRGKPVADALGQQLMERMKALRAQGVTPTLALVRVGEREDDLAYERGALKRCEALGIDARPFVLPAMCTQAELMDVISQVNADAAIHGCLIFRPLPAHLDETAVCQALEAEKDVDGITQGSAFGVFADQKVGFPPCTAAACIRLLEHYGVELDGANVAVVGRSLVIGRPVAMMLTAANATVTLCHTHTRDLAAACRSADILVVAAGHAGTIGADAVSAGQTLVDVGINWDEEAGRLVGDVVYDEAAPVVARITPVPGGVGSVTTAVLAEHVITAAERASA